MSRFQELTWFTTSTHLPVANRPLLIRLDATPTYPLRAIRLNVEYARYGFFFILANDLDKLPTVDDLDERNTHCPLGVLEWAYL